MNETQEEEVCRLIGFLPFTYEGRSNDWPTLGSEDRWNWQMAYIAAAVMAEDHLNARSDAVVPQLSQMMENCTGLSFSLEEFVNTDSSQTVVADAMMNLSYQDVCGVVGLHHNEVAETVALLAQSLQVPVITHHATANELTSNAPSTAYMARTTVNFHPRGEAVAHWLQKSGRTNYVAVVMPTARDTLQAKLGLMNGLSERNFTNVMVQVVDTGREVVSKIDQALSQIQQSGYRTIVWWWDGGRPYDEGGALAKDLDAIFAFADAAERYQLLTDDYVWTIADTWDLPVLVQDLAPQNANLTKLLNGASMVRPLDGFDYRNTVFRTPDPFLESWKRQPVDVVHRIHQLYPNTTVGHSPAPPSFFDTPPPGAAFLYDAIIAQGLGKCKYEADKRNPESNSANEQKEQHSRRTRGLKGVRRQSSRALQQPKKKKTVLPPPERMQAIYDRPFEGATGRVAFGEVRGKFAGSRQRQDVTFGVYNIRPPSFYLTHVLYGGPVQGTWYETPDTPFLYASGSSVPPALLRDVPEQNFLSDPVQYVGWSAFAVLVFYITSSLGFVVAFRKAPAIRQNQPVFLMLMLFGCLMLSAAIFTVSMDEQDGISQDGLSAMCLSTIWLLVLGYIIIYAALFCKLWRINKLLQFSRRKVEVHHVVGPMVVVTVAAVLALSLWTALDPFVWVREEVDVDSGESYGKCSSNNSLPYLLSVIGLIVVTMIAAVVMTWRTKDIDERFSEAKWIFYTVFVQIQLLILGVPVLVILGTESADATFLGRSLLIFLVVATTVSFMIGPKAIRVFEEWREKKNQTSPDHAERGTSSFSQASTPNFNGNASRGTSIGGPARISGLNLPTQQSTPSILENVFEKEEKGAAEASNDSILFASELTCDDQSGPMDETWRQSLEVAKELQHSNGSLSINKEQKESTDLRHFDSSLPEMTPSKDPSDCIGDPVVSEEEKKSWNG